MVRGGGAQNSSRGAVTSNPTVGEKVQYPLALEPRVQRFSNHLHVKDCVECWTEVTDVTPT